MKFYNKDIHESHYLLFKKETIQPTFI